MANRFSVRFFKRLITVVVLLMILSLTIALVISTFRIAMLTKTMTGVSEVSAETSVYSDKVFSYQKKYPDFNVKRTSISADNEDEKVVYLTFDDGPSKVNTVKILDILKENDIPATFFVVHNDADYAVDIIKRAIKEGNAIGIHTWSHDYKKIYKSVDSFLEDYNKMYEYLVEQCNYTPKIFRFPGGSINEYNLNVYDQIIPEMYRRGFTFYDWNVSAQDAVIGYISAKQIENSVVKEVKTGNKNIVLMHDSADKDNTVEALPQIIKRLKAAGYTFKTLDSSVRPITFIQ